MLLTIVLGIIASVCLVSTLIVYVIMRSQESRRSSLISVNEKQQIKTSFPPSFDMITKRLTREYPSRTSTSSGKSNRSSSIKYYEENEISLNKSSKSAESLRKAIIPTRSSSMVSSLLQGCRPRTSNWRHGSIFDSNQISAIRFTLPSINPETKYRRQSVPVLHCVLEPSINLLSTSSQIRSSCLLAFSIIYLKNSQLKIELISIEGLPIDLQLQFLTIKVKLYPDGKEKSIQIRKLIEKEMRFGDENNELFILFSNISNEKVHEKSLSITIQGKDQTKKTIHLGQIGKILFNQIDQFDNENRLDFLHEIEKIKPSSIELLISLQKKDDQHIIVDLQRIKGLKIDQKKLDAKFYFEIVLIDHHRILTTKQTKCFQFNSSNIILDQQNQLNILTFNSNNLDRLMIMIDLYSNSNQQNQSKRIAHLKLASPLFCSGSGTIHWQQFKARESFSMWHTLNKQ